MNASEPTGEREKQCANCGATFSCGRDVETGCWCETREAIAPSKRFADCLCPKCLDAEIAKSTLRTEPK